MMAVYEHRPERIADERNADVLTKIDFVRSLISNPVKIGNNTYFNACLSKTPLIISGSVINYSLPMFTKHHKLCDYRALLADNKLVQLWASGSIDKVKCILSSSHKSLRLENLSFAQLEQIVEEHILLCRQFNTNVEIAMKIKQIEKL